MPPMMPPQGMPPQGGGGGMDPSQMQGNALLQVFQQLMSDPVAGRAMQAAIPMLMGGAGGAPGAPPAPGGGGMPPVSSQNMPVGGAPVEGGPPQGADDAEAMANQAIQSPDGTWEGDRQPTPADIAKLQDRPTDTNVESFDEQFGDGAAARYLGGQGGNGGNQGPPDAEDKQDQGADEKQESDY